MLRTCAPCLLAEVGHTPGSRLGCELERAWPGHESNSRLLLAGGRDLSQQAGARCQGDRPGQRSRVGTSSLPLREAERSCLQSSLTALAGPSPVCTSWWGATSAVGPPESSILCNIDAKSVPLLSFSGFCAPSSEPQQPASWHLTRTCLAFGIFSRPLRSRPELPVTGPPTYSAQASEAREESLDRCASLESSNCEFLDSSNSGFGLEEDEH